jgi:hypothetical protein
VPPPSPEEPRPGDGLRTCLAYASDDAAVDAPDCANAYRQGSRLVVTRDRQPVLGFVVSGVGRGHADDPRRSRCLGDS